MPRKIKWIYRDHPWSDDELAEAHAFARELFGPLNGQEIFDPPLSDSVRLLAEEKLRERRRSRRRRPASQKPIAPQSPKPADNLALAAIPKPQAAE